jgi:hypothetical protein
MTEEQALIELGRRTYSAVTLTMPLLDNAENRAHIRAIIVQAREQAYAEGLIFGIIEDIDLAFECEDGSFNIIGMPLTPRAEDWMREKASQGLLM